MGRYDYTSRLQELVRDWCKERDRSMTELAKSLEIRRTRLSELLSGSRLPDYRTVRAMARTMNLKSRTLAKLVQEARLSWLKAEGHYAKKWRIGIAPRRSTEPIPEEKHE